MDTILSYFSAPGPTTDVSDYSGMLAELPADPEKLAEIVRGLVLHQGVAAQAGLEFSADRLVDRERVGAAAILERVLDLDDSPLHVERKPERRMIGYCYHFSVLHCAILRARGVPARARCGFAAYYGDGSWIDHWVVEYWRDDGWVMIDPDSGRDVLTTSEFHNAGLAWRLCRKGLEDPSRHGNHVLWGWDELRGSLICDVGALNKCEVGDWETWCDLIAIEEKDQPSADLDTYLDSLADLVTSDSGFEPVRSAFARDNKLRPPVESLTVFHRSAT